MDLQLSKNFNIREFMCKDGTHVPDIYIANVATLAYMLEQIRLVFNRPIYITSGYRTNTHNTKVGGSVQSWHLQAKAVDFYILGIDPAQIGIAIQTLWERNKILHGGLGVYSNFVHYDLRGHINIFKQ